MFGSHGVYLPFRLVIVVMMLFHHGNGAAGLRDGAAYMLELHSGVRDSVAMFEQRVEAAQNAVARRRRHVFDQHVAAQCVGAGTKTPDVKVVDTQHAAYAAHSSGHIHQPDTARQPLQQNVERFPNDVSRRPDDQ